MSDAGAMEGNFEMWDEEEILEWMGQIENLLKEIQSI